MALYGKSESQNNIAGLEEDKKNQYDNQDWNQSMMININL